MRFSSILNFNAHAVQLMTPSYRGDAVTVVLTMHVNMGYTRFRFQLSLNGELRYDWTEMVR